MKQNKTADKTPFPVYLFLTYFIFYCGHAVYNTYGTVFLSQNGFSQSVIGIMSSVATLVLVLIQPLWGVISDKSKNKNRIAGLLIVLCGISGLAVYLMKELWWIALCTMSVAVFFSPAITLQDNCTLEMTEGTRWNFGNIRLGGTLGYLACAAVMGLIIRDYSQIYWWIALFFIPAGLMLMCMRRHVGGHRHKEEKVHYRVLLQNRPLVWLIVFNIIYFIANTFSRYYTVYYSATLGATPFMLSMTTMVSGLAEIPFFWYAGKIQKKLGIERYLIMAALSLIVKHILLCFVTNPWLVILVHALNGCGFSTFNFCILNYINENVPKSMRATSQSLNSILSTVFASILFAPVAGVCADFLGSGGTLLVGAVIMLGGIILFKCTFSRSIRKQSQTDM
ncbi:MAG: MFS transporter [Oscillospiraceae bacterium]|nr:MFS transporter [Oscillospiraceae bacterium]MDY3064589.1 MFS transporter [Oscillospiraceae bacterium]